MSNFISSISAAGLSEMPPRVEGDPLADESDRGRARGIALIAQDDELWRPAVPRATASSAPMPSFSISAPVRAPRRSAKTPWRCLPPARRGTMACIHWAGGCPRSFARFMPCAIASPWRTAFSPSASSAAPRHGQGQFSQWPPDVVGFALESIEPIEGFGCNHHCLGYLQLKSRRLTGSRSGT